MASANCSFQGCDGKAQSKGLCAAHYQQKKCGQELRPVKRTGPRREEHKEAKLLRNPFNIDPRESLKLLNRLDKRRRQILDLLMRGKTYMSIARTLGIKKKRVIEGVCNCRRVMGLPKMTCKFDALFGRVYWSAVALGEPWEKAHQPPPPPPEPPKPWRPVRNGCSRQYD